MKQITIFLATLLLVVGSLSAQVATASPQPANDSVSHLNPTFPQWSIGAAVGLDLNVPVAGVAYMNEVSYVPQFGFGFALSVAYRPCKWFAVRSGLNLMDKNYFYMHKVTLDENDGTLGTLTSCKYLDLPVMADFSIGKKVRWHFLLGGYVGYWLSGHRMGTSFPLLNVDFSGFVDEPYPFNSVRDNRFDAGLIYGPALSITCSRRVDINIELLFLHGLTDVQKNYMMQLNPHYNTTALLQTGVTFKL